ncbi:MAG: DnaA regulatory inactivator Hda [Betaproteobacteria bacterium]|nr:DnaA regulatory inactivator Hda [Betaproteobacteria bacterium]
MQQLLLDIRPPARPDLARFVAGRNIELLAQLEAMLDGTAAERSVYVWGAPGSGKSYLLAAWAHACEARGMVVDFTGRHAAQAVIADEVETWSDARQHDGFAAFNRVREAGGLWLAAGNAPPAELPVMPELRTRLGWGLVFHLQGLDDAEKRAALARHAESLGFRLDAQVADYLLNHTARDMQSLLRVLEALDRFSLETRRPITLPLLRQLLRGF